MAEIATQALAPEERAALVRARRAFARGSVAAAAAAIAGGAALAGSLLGVPSRGILPLAAVLCVAWAWLLRRMPARYLAATRELAAGTAETVQGIAALRTHRGIGLLAPASPRLLLEGRRLALQPAQAERIREGMAVRARVAPAAGVLLSIEPAAASTAGRQAASAPVVAAQDLLSPREARLLQLIAAGHSDKAIARELGLEPATVRTYNSQLYAKLQVGSRTAALARARALGMLTDVED